MLHALAEFVNATVPTIRGPIVVAATPQQLSVSVPCNTQAILCIQLGQEWQELGNDTAVEATLLLDGATVASTKTEQHLCTLSLVGCSATPRVLSVQPASEL